LKLFPRAYLVGNCLLESHEATYPPSIS
jgi:hypothetical protein